LNGYRELGEQYLIERTEAKRQKYLKSELAKLGYDVSELKKQPPQKDLKSESDLHPVA
jgi:hypothetical protein